MEFLQEKLNLEKCTTTAAAAAAAAHNVPFIEIFKKNI